MSAHVVLNIRTHRAKAGEVEREHATRRLGVGQQEPGRIFLVRQRVAKHREFGRKRRRRRCSGAACRGGWTHAIGKPPEAQSEGNGDECPGQCRRRPAVHDRVAYRQRDAPNCHSKNTRIGECPRCCPTRGGSCHHVCGVGWFMGNCLGCACKKTLTVCAWIHFVLDHHTLLVPRREKSSVSLAVASASCCAFAKLSVSTAPALSDLGPGWRTGNANLATHDVASCTRDIPHHAGMRAF
jgi:hypothetical protein